MSYNIPEALKDFILQGLSEALTPATNYANLLRQPESAQDYIFYIDPAGDDSNDGLTPLTPFLTLDRAFASMPMFWGRKARIIAAAGTYPVTGAKTWIFGTSFGAGGEPLLIQGSYTVDAMGTRTVTSSTESAAGTTITDSTLAMGALAHEGAVFEVLTGTQAGKAALVYRHTADTFTVNTLLGGLAPGDTFQIKRPAVIFNCDSEIGIGTTEGMGTELGQTVPGYQPGLALSGVRFNFTTAAGKIRYSNTVVFHEGVEYIGGGALSIVSGNSVILTDGTFSGILDAFSALRRAVHFYARDAHSYVGVIVSAGGVTGPIVLGACGLTLNARAIGTITPFFMRGGRILAQRSSFLYVFGTASIHGVIDGAAGDAIMLNNNDAILAQVEVSNSAGDGVHVDYGTRIQVSDLTGTGNSGHGLVVTHGARVAISGGVNTITGAGGDVRVGAVTKTWAEAEAGFTDGLNAIGDDAAQPAAGFGGPIDLSVDPTIRGKNDGTGVVVGHVPTGPGTGSTLKLLYVTTAQRNQLDVLSGMLIYNSDTGTCEIYQNDGWHEIGWGASVRGPFLQINSTNVGLSGDISALIEVLTDDGAGALDTGTLLYTFGGNGTNQGTWRVDARTWLFGGLDLQGSGIKDALAVVNSNALALTAAHGLLSQRFQLANDASEGALPTYDTPTLSGVAPAQPGGANAITLDPASSALDDYYTGWWINLGGNQLRRISAYNGTTKVATITLEAPWSAEPVEFDAYDLYDKVYVGPVYIESTGRVTFLYSHSQDTAFDLDGNLRYADAHARYLYLEEGIRGKNDGTGVVIGNAGTGPGTGSTLQIVSMTEAERNDLVPAEGMVIKNLDIIQLQQYIDGAWRSLGADGGIVLTAAESINAYELVSLADDGLHPTPNASTEATANFVGVALTDASNPGDPVRVHTVPGVAVKMWFTSPPAAVDNGSPVYLSDDLNGNVELEAPSRAVQVGYLYGADGITSTPLVIYQPGPKPNIGTITDANGLATGILLSVTVNPGGGGVADDITIFAANLPFDVEIMDVMFVCTGGNSPGRTVQIRSAAGGGGDALSDSFDCTLTGRFRETDSTAIPALPAGDSMFLRRSDNAIYGRLIVWLAKL